MSIEKRIRPYWILLLAAAWWPVAATAADKPTKEPNTLTAKEKERGVELLFDGKTTNGWRGFKSDKFPEKGWEVVDGSIHKIAGGGGGDILTEKEYENFVLRFEWKVAPGANSGVFYRGTEEKDRIYETSQEYQILDDDKHPDGKSELTSAAANYALYPRTQGKPNPVGEWNQGRIVARGSHIEHWLNGDKVMECDLGSDAWKEKVKNSKFADWELFGTREKGHIGLQDHGDEVWFRNIKIRPLND